MTNGALAFMKDYGDLIRHEGNRQLFEAVEMSIISQLWGEPLHLHAEGVRGTGKTTILRAARRILPTIERIRGCPYNCDPQAPHCPLHAGWTPGQVKAHGTERVPMPFREISPSAKVGTVTGSLDLARLTDRSRPEAALLPGTLAQAHRGIVFVDEINRLADVSPELVDCLLDVMGTKPGRLQIEETGLPPVELPVRVAVWAASNPDEEPGPLEEIRRQLSDRFDMVLDVRRPAEVWLVKRILQIGRPFRGQAGPEREDAVQVSGVRAGVAGTPASPAGPRNEEPENARAGAREGRGPDHRSTGTAGQAPGPLPVAGRTLPAGSSQGRETSRDGDSDNAPAGRHELAPSEPVDPAGSPDRPTGAAGSSPWWERWQQVAAMRPRFPDPLLDLLAEVYVQFRLESLRALEAWRQAAALHAVRGGRETVLRDDLLEVAPAVLRHRVDAVILAEVLEHLSRDDGVSRGAATAAGSAGGGHAGVASGIQDGGQPLAQRWAGAARPAEGGMSVAHGAPVAGAAVPDPSESSRVSCRSGDLGWGAASRVWGRLRGMLARATGAHSGAMAGGSRFPSRPESQDSMAVPQDSLDRQAWRPTPRGGGTPPRRARPLLELSRDRVIRSWTGP